MSKNTDLAQVPHKVVQSLHKRVVVATFVYVCTMQHSKAKRKERPQP